MALQSSFLLPNTYTADFCLLLLKLKLAITKVTGISFGKFTRLWYARKYQNDAPTYQMFFDPNSATNNCISFNLCSFSKLMFSNILYFNKIKPFKNYKKCFLCHLKHSYSSWIIPIFDIFSLFAQNIRISAWNWKWDNYDFMKCLA